MNRNLSINEVSWLCTHNAFNSQDEIGASAGSPGGTNQNHSINAQLEAGVRVFMIDVHNFHNAPRVCHSIPDPYEDLCDLLIKFKKWLIDNDTEIIILLMEVAKDVPAEWIKETFEGAGPITRSDDYNLKDMLYTHPDWRDPWPTIADLVQDSKRVIVFRETDEEKGQITTGMDWYHDMWIYWIETPYGNSHWDDLQFHTYQLLRGNPDTASFFNLNHFVNTGFTGSGSAGFAQGMNMDDYLTARALIAWRMQGRRPTLSVDFFKSLEGAKPEDTYDTVKTADDLDNISSVWGKITFQDGSPFHSDVTWEGIEDLNFKDNIDSNDYRYQSGSDGPGAAKPTSHNGYFCFPPNGYNKSKDSTKPMTLKPYCEGYAFTPDNYEWDGEATATQDFTVEEISIIS